MPTYDVVLLETNKKSKLTQQAAAADCKYFANHSEVKDMPCKQKDEF